MQSRKLLISLICLLVICQYNDTIAQTKQLSSKIANYDMDILLDAKTKTLKGKTTLRWKNISDQPIDELYFHMYYNAFKNARSTFFKERGVPEFLTTDIDDTCGWGWTHISSFKDNYGNELSDRMNYVQTDDDNIYDQSVLKIDLIEPVLADSMHIFYFEWEAKIPKTMPRTGYNKDFYFLAQWFPKLGVLEPKGMRFAKETQWNCHQYHSNGEYYSDFGDYDVTLTVPSDFIVASSGELNSKVENESTSSWNFKAIDVIDFTWTCSPHYELYTEKYKNTELKFYCYPYKRHVKERYFKAIKFAMKFLDDRLMDYPYSTLSIVDPPIHGMFTGGMEYPTLITSLSFCFFPKGFKTPETLVVHEYIHQYFMQMVATHEVEETWMDEGITSYYESRILDSLMGTNESTIDFLGFKTGNKTFNRVEYFGMDHPSIESNDAKSWEYKHGGYGEIAYNKTALWLQTLEGIIGQESMDLIMKEYFMKWKFKHPSRYDFIQIVNDWVMINIAEKFPDGMDWFFEQVLYGTGTCDYSVASIRNIETIADKGIFDHQKGCEVKDVNKPKYNSRVVFYRLDEMYFPLDIKVFFEDGSEEHFKWDGKARSHDITIESDLKIVKAIIDPELKIYIDKNFINNSLSIEPNKSALNKLSANLFLKVQSIVEFISFLL